jgi:hypothetical protein
MPWVANGVQVCAAINSQDTPAIAFTGAPDGQAPANTSGYHVWAGLDGGRDERSASGDGGNRIQWTLETPFLDEGNDSWKRLLRLGVNVEGDVGAFTVAIITDPPEGGRTLSLESNIEGDVYAVDEFDPNPEVAIYDESLYASEDPSAIITGIPPGVRGRRWRAEVHGDADGEAGISSLSFDGVLLPERRGNR